MWSRRQVLGALVVGLAVAQPVSAQDKAVGIAVRGGGFNSVTDLNEAGTADFRKTGYNVGATVGIDLTKVIALRGDFTFARNELQQNDVATGVELNRFLYDAGVQIQHESNGFKPYLFVGAGAVTLHPVGTTDIDQTKFAGTGGIGASYTLPGSNLGFIVEGKSWVYEFPELGGSLSGFGKTQVDVTWSAGISYRLPLSRSAARQ
jgi:hypothetical protein